MLRSQDLLFEPLFTAEPHVFISSTHPLAGRESVTLDELDDFPYLSYEQGDFNSFYFSEELLQHARPPQEHPRARPSDAV